MGKVPSLVALSLLVAMSGGCSLPMLPAFDTLASSRSAPRGEPVDIALDRAFAVGDMLTMEIDYTRSASEGRSFAGMLAEESESAFLRVRVAVLAVDEARAPTMLDLRFERATRSGGAEVEGKDGPAGSSILPAIAPGALARATVINGDWELQQMQGRAPSEVERALVRTLFGRGALEVLSRSAFGDASRRRVGEEWNIAISRYPISGAGGPMMHHTARLDWRGTAAQGDVVRLRSRVVTPVISNNQEGPSLLHRRVLFERELLTPIDRERLPLQLHERVTIEVAGYERSTSMADGLSGYESRVGRVIEDVRVRYSNWIRATPTRNQPLRQEGAAEGDGVAT